ncbi:glycoside hydrolase family 2 protein [Pelagicoccus mobilis]|uniref:Glycoside hydrolase family 2 n=1 Tax=Pelagicoccus mobilis TaxID=415221 RepID=A0A934S333_9BACT|nr:sugar-binding domain-containing protein [Pelagicoccus mobilis]MBK1879766.1 hypothetical protein [Pelagicoccus mobilis]
MKKIAAVVSATIGMTLMSNAEWKPVEGTMLTEWGQTVTPENAWTEYPRPQLVRDDWTNLNGIWDVAITKDTAEKPKKWTDEILVPFALETPLSGIGKRLELDEVIWYRRDFELASAPEGRLHLNFEGVDYACRVWVNGGYAGSHVGGNLPFSFDVTELVQSGENEIVMRVVDDTDSADRYQLRGKQKRKNSGIWYSPSSGIWQTVWLEETSETYLESIKFVGDMHGGLDFEARVVGESANGAKVRVSVLEGGETVSKKTGPASGFSLKVKDAKLWSPDEPSLYDLKVELLDRKGKVTETIDSYVGFRSVGKETDADGNLRFTLNGEEIFHLGPLDQGWWPDGFLNPPSDEAIVFEMDFLKEAGFNMIRKHKKVEPRRYYYHADRLGFLVWQDHVSGGAGPNEWPIWKKLRAELPDYEPKNNRWWKPEDGDNLEADWPDWAHEQCMAELKVMIDTLYNNPSVVVWTTFNERWGQHRSMKVGKWVEEYDTTRHLNIASGGNFFEVGDIADEHNYPDPSFPLALEVFDDYVKVVGEFGGHGWPVEGHLWSKKKRNWGYGGLPKTIEEYKERYVRSMEILGELKENGIAAGVYTQTTDVEGEINGILTYDRKVVKIAPEELAEIHRKAGLLDSE